MARPPMPLGGYNSIIVRPVPGTTRYRAQAYIRDLDGKRRRVERWGDSGPKAKRALQEELTTRAAAGQNATGLTPNSRFRDASETWMADVERIRRGTTIDNYRQRLDSLVLPAIGELRLREISVGMLDRFMAGLQKRGLSVSTRRNVRTVLTGTFGVAVRHGAAKSNPARDLTRIEGKGKRGVRALTAAEREDLLAKLDADEAAVRRDIPDLVRFMLGTGVRIGEAFAVRWCDVDLDVGVVAITGNIVRVRGKGLVRNEGKTAAARRVLALPAFLCDLLAFRQTPAASPDEPVLPNSKLGWRDPANTGRMLREARSSAGYPWLTSHVFRKTAATILDEQRFTARQIADQLGQARPSITQDVYMHRGELNPAVASALDDAMRAKT